MMCDAVSCVTRCCSDIWKCDIIKNGGWGETLVEKVGVLA